LIIADTDVIIDFFTDTVPVSDEILKIILEKRLCLTSMTVYELYAGVIGKKRLNQVETLITSVPIFSLGVTEAAIAGKIYTYLKAKGKLIGHRDIIIAGICIANGLPLFTKNMTHFRMIPQLDLYSVSNENR
jgi:predicted nucleic acid-binding protein